MAGTSIKKAGIDPTTSATTGTFSFWVKFHNARTDGNDYFLFSTYDDGNSRMHIKIDGNQKLDINEKISSSTSINLVTNRKFRDTSGWYHIVVAINSTQATAADRVKVYINGTQETSFSSNTYPSQNEDIHCLQGNKIHYVGCYGGNVNSANYCLDGSMSHLHFADGQQYAASVFGETDTTTGEWKIKTTPTVTYGNNGWFILKDGNSLTNQAGNSAGNFTLDTGTLTKCEDNPSNVFATLNPLQGGQAETMGLMEGGLYLSGNGSSSWRVIGATLADNSGKYYWEGKVIGGVSQMRIGICDVTQIPTSAGTKFTVQSRGYGVDTSNLVNNNGNVGGFTVTSFTTNDILMFAMDLDNSKLYIGKNGTWMNSGDPTSGSTGTGAASITSGYYYTPCSEHYDSSANFAYNFGSGNFRTTAVASAGTNASNNGVFEYNVPTGYTALSTKGLNT